MEEFCWAWNASTEMKQWIHPECRHVWAWHWAILDMRTSFFQYHERAPQMTLSSSNTYIQLGIPKGNIGPNYLSVYEKLIDETNGYCCYSNLFTQSWTQHQHDNWHKCCSCEIVTYTTCKCCMVDHLMYQFSQKKGSSCMQIWSLERTGMPTHQLFQRFLKPV